MLPPALLAAQSPDDLPVVLALLGAIEEQWLILAADADQVLDDAFPDSAADWALPYLAQLLGLPADAGRAEIGSATALRRRRGTPAALEDFAEVVTGWPSRATEGWQTTVWCQQLSHPVRRTASLSMRAREQLLIGTQLDPARRSVTPGGPDHPAGAAATVFPWQVYRYNAAEVCPLPDGRYALHPLGLETPLYLRPQPLVIASDAEDELPPGVTLTPRPPRAPGDLPLRATWQLIESLGAGQITYGPFWQLGPGHPLTGNGPDGPALLALTANGTPVPWASIGLTSLPSGGGPAPAADQVLADPSRGVIAVGTAITGPVRATFYRPASGRIGALASTAEPDDSAGTVIIVDPAGGEHAPGQLVCTDLTAAMETALHLPGPGTGPGPDVEIRIETSDRVAAPAQAVMTTTPSVSRWRIIAPTAFTPVIYGDLTIGMPGAQVELAGCYLSDNLVAGAGLTALTLTSVTMNPAAGRVLSVETGAWLLRLSASLCALAPVRADLSAFPVSIADCVVDGAGIRLNPCGAAAPPPAPVPAVAAADRFPPGLVATAATFAGPVAVDTIEAADCLFTGGVHTVVTSSGCLRYSHLGDHDNPTAHPPAHQCVSGPLPTLMSAGAESAGYYAPVLAAPGQRGANPVLAGASDGGEIGAYHHAGRGRLALRLAQRLAEMTPLTVHPHLIISPAEE
jgi:hypothetical protein